MVNVVFVWLQQSYFGVGSRWSRNSTAEEAEEKIYLLYSSETIAYTLLATQFYHQCHKELDLNCQLQIYQL